MDLHHFTCCAQTGSDKGRPKVQFFAGRPCRRGPCRRQCRPSIPPNLRRPPCCRPPSRPRASSPPTPLPTQRQLRSVFFFWPECRASFSIAWNLNSQIPLKVRSPLLSGGGGPKRSAIHLLPTPGGGGGTLSYTYIAPACWSFYDHLL